MRATGDWPRVRLDKGPGDWVIDCGIINGRRRVFRRKTELLAEVKAAELRAERKKLGELAFALTPAQRIEAAQCYDALEAASYGTPLLQIVQERLAGAPATTDPITLGRAIELRLEDMARRQLRERSVESARSRLLSFGKHNMTYCVNEVKAVRVSAFLTKHSPATQAAYIRELSAFFVFCMKRGYCATNPCAGIDPPKIDRGVPEFMPVDDVARFMQFLYNHEKYSRYYVHAALGFFAGLRPEEIRRMFWTNVNLQERIITIGPEIAKTRRVRHVTISDNLLAWLTTSYVGPLSFDNFDHVRRQVCKALGIKWPHDCARHTFATFHLALHRNAGETAHEMGHTQGVDLLYKHYRGLATREDSERFWNILPNYTTEGVTNE